ncbi:MAG TPA: rhodanese-like domain-containing protein [Syntrophomonadaceae bacterium]|nr:rhodanese-like domain-containing protein [Syntrophomonadaceae bacterium]
MTNLRRNRVFVILAVFVLLAVVAGCGTQNTSTQTKDKATKETATPKVSMEKLANDYFQNMPENIYKIPLEELKAKVDANDSSILIVDIRKTEDYNKGHIKGSVNIPFAQMGKYLDKLPGDKEIIVACYTGQTAGQTVAVLNIYGYKARSLHLGVQKGWVEKSNYPLDTTAVSLPTGVTPAKAPSAEIAKQCADYFNNMPETLNKIDADKLKAKIDAKEDIQIVSIRDAKDYVKGDIPGAINIPFKEVNKNLDKISKDKPVVISCYTGQTAGQTVAILKLLGYDALSLSSGFDLGWTAGGFPVTVPK